MSWFEPIISINVRVKDTSTCSCVYTQLCMYMCVLAFTDVVLDVWVVSHSCWSHVLPPTCLKLTSTCAYMVSMLPQLLLLNVSTNLDVSITKAMVVSKSSDSLWLFLFLDTAALEGSTAKIHGAEISHTDPRGCVDEDQITHTGVRLRCRRKGVSGWIIGRVVQVMVKSIFSQYIWHWH